ncbi:site-specific integrase [Leptolyngbya sp. BC1307]|uniref:site-specific integrase n=1 Tax=Leptolyngbya sp. BC1307 TaxID=2029589 RepID=UPI000EFA6A8E|nr:site-specific integrase [Leptolyngbya sp. BC1307]
MTIHPFDVQISTANQRLKAAQMGLKIDRRGEKLSLRGTFPPRPGSPKLRAYQQRIPLGLPATKAGLKQIEKAAKVIAAQLIENTFDWQDYLGPVAGLRRAGADLSAQIAAFETYFFDLRQGTSQPASVRTTWEKAYVPYLRKLQAIATQHPSFSLPEAIYATVQSTSANSRSRQVCCTALDALATFLNTPLPTPLKSFWGNYGNSKTQVRHLPTDEEILSAYERIPNPTWKFVYGIMATYGLRNHEVFFCDYTLLASGDEEAAIEVLAHTKTGQHDVWPFYPEWIDAFNLRQVTLPKINTDLNITTLQRVGQTVSKQFERYDVPFNPYDLRHAWAVRTVHMGLPDTVSARMMGHSVAIHNRTYHRWITRRDQSAAVKAALRNN